MRLSRIAIVLPVLTALSAAGTARAYMTPDQVFGGDNIPDSARTETVQEQPAPPVAPAPAETPADTPYEAYPAAAQGEEAAQTQQPETPPEPSRPNYEYALPDGTPPAEPVRRGPATDPGTGFTDTSASSSFNNTITEPPVAQESPDPLQPPVQMVPVREPVAAPVNGGSAGAESSSQAPLPVLSESAPETPLGLAAKAFAVLVVMGFALAVGLVAMRMNKESPGQI